MLLLSAVSGHDEPNIDPCLRNVNIEPDDNDEVNNKKNTTKTRTFSETLKMLDDDILADLDVK